MDEPTFHAFGKLPAELRVKIWEFAVHPTVGYRGGVQYFDWKCCTPPPLAHPGHRQLHTREQLPKISSDRQRCRSAYRWDAGLAGACRESDAAVRGASARVTTITDTNEVEFWGYETLGLISSMPRESRLRAVQEGQPEWTVMYKPERDLLVLQHSLPFLRPSFLSADDYTDVTDCLYHWVIKTLTMVPDAEFEVSHIGIEFPGRWKDDLEIDNRAFWMDCNIFKALLDKLLEVSEYPRAFYLWIVDRTATAPISSSASTAMIDTEVQAGVLKPGGPVLFYDLDNEYVPINIGRIYDSDIDPNDLAASFLCTMRESLTGERQLDFDRLVGILACRDFHTM